MTQLIGNPRKIFKKIYKRYKSNNLINSNELIKYFPNIVQLKQDLDYLRVLDLIDIDTKQNYHLTTKGREYFKAENHDSFETVIKSIFCPIIVSVITTLTTMWLSSL